MICVFVITILSPVRKRLMKAEKKTSLLPNKTIALRRDSPNRQQIVPRKAKTNKMRSMRWIFFRAGGVKGIVSSGGFDLSEGIL